MKANTEDKKNTVEYQKQKFSNVLKGNNIRHITSFIINPRPPLQHKDKIDTVISNLCSLKIANIAEIIKMMHLKPTDGSVIPLYIKAVECRPEIFGFIHSHFSVSKQLRFSAYAHAAKLGRIDILRKIRDIDSVNMTKIYEYIKDSPVIPQKVKVFVVQEYSKATSLKDGSPKHYLKTKLKNQIRQKLEESKKRSSSKKSSSKKKSK
jgi:hypothetical protein